MQDRDLGTRDVWEGKKRERERRLVNPGRGGAESMKRACTGTRTGRALRRRVGTTCEEWAAAGESFRQRFAGGAGGCVCHRGDGRHARGTGAAGTGTRKGQLRYRGSDTGTGTGTPGYSA